MYYYAQPRSAQAHAGFQIEGEGKLHTKPRGFILNYTEAREGKRSERNLANLGPRGHKIGRKAKQPGARMVICESRTLGLALLGEVSEVKVGQLNTRPTS